MGFTKNCNLGYVDIVQVCFDLHTTIFKRLYFGKFSENSIPHKEHSRGHS
jgi:hypothetical protein